MKMDGIEKSFYAYLPVCVLQDQTEGISNKYRMPQKCTLPSREPGARTGSVHPNTIFIMPWPHKVITLVLDDWDESAAKNGSKHKWAVLHGSFQLSLSLCFIAQTHNARVKAGRGSTTFTRVTRAVLVQPHSIEPLSLTFWVRVEKMQGRCT